MRTVEELSSVEELEVGPQLHKSLENVCFHGKFRQEAVVIKRVIVSRADSLDKFEDEVSILVRPDLAQYVVAPRAVVRSPPHYSIVLPLMENGSINSLLERCELPVELVVCFAIDSARALAHVHMAGYVHRDIKSANVLVDAEWRAWLTDLGSAERVRDAEGNTIKNAMDTSSLVQPSGGFHKKNIDGTTLGYTAPEVLRNTPATQASDVYGLGMTVAEMLTGLPPYQGMEKEDADMHTVMDASYSEHALILAITTENLRPGLVSVSEQAGMPMELIDLVRAMWHADPAQRPTAVECVERLEAIAGRLGFETEHGEGRRSLAALIREKVVPGAAADPNDVLLEPHLNGDLGARPTATDGYEVHDVPTVPLDQSAMEVDGAADEQPGAPRAYNKAIPVGAFATSGRRGADKMEDRHSVAHFFIGPQRGELSVCSVFDGHGGPACAHLANARLPGRIGAAFTRAEQFPSEAERAQIVTREFVEADLAFRNGPTADKSGCTAMSAVFWHPDRAAQPDKVRLLVANAGDCRAVLCRAQGGVDSAIRLSRDHNASSPQEQDRIRAAGGTIQLTRDGKHRVQGHIQVTRALGDAAMKPFGVTAEPEIFEYDLSAANGDDFVIFATDGVWDTLTDQDAVRMVRSTAKECGLAAKRIGGEALARGSSDNISVIVVFLKKFDQHQDVAFVGQ